MLVSRWSLTSWCRIIKYRCWYRSGNYNWWLRDWIILQLNICNTFLLFFHFFLSNMNNCDSGRLLLNLDWLRSNTFCDGWFIYSLWSITAYWCTDGGTRWCWLIRVLSFTYRPTYKLFKVYCISIFEIISKNVQSCYCF